MPGIDKATGRVTALIVFLVVAATALRGYLPGDEHPPRAQPTSSPANPIAVAALLSVSVAILVIALVAMRRRQAVPAAFQELPDLPDGLGGWSGPRRWRWLLVGVGVILAWLVILVLLARVVVPPPIDVPPSGTGSTTAPGSNGSAPPPSAQPETGGYVLGYLAAATVAMFLLLAAGIVVAFRRNRHVAKPCILTDDDYPPPAGPSGPESLVRAAELGLAEIGDPSLEPRQAIIACYAAMEHALVNAPEAVPLDSDTPTEVLARAVEHHALHADSATELVELFTEARFSPHVMTEEHREVAVRVLRLVLDELRASTRGSAA